MSWYEDMVVMGLPTALGIVGAKMRDKDKDEKGPDDAWGRLMLTMAPYASSLVMGGKAGESSTLKAMRAIELVAHEYRASVGDVKPAEAE